MFRSCLLVCLLAFGLLSGGAAQAAAAPESATIEVIPAFDSDLPVSGAPGAKLTQAKSVAALAPWICTAYASDPWKTAGTIRGEGSSTCTGSGWAPQMVKATVQRYLGAGIWQNKASSSSGWSNNATVYRGVAYNCRGTGTQTYRIVVDAYADYASGGVAVQSQNYLRVRCEAA